MSLERADERVRLAERQVAILAKTGGERVFEWAFILFAVYCIGYLLVKALLVGLGVTHTIASPVMIIICMLVLTMCGSFMLIRTIARKIAAHELKQSKIYLSQFRHMSPMAYTGTGTTTGGGYSNYKRPDRVMTGKQFAAEVKASAAAESNAHGSSAAVRQTTSMMRSGRR